MSKYGYIGKESDIPQQAFQSNTGVLSVNDHLGLSQENKLTQYGQLELIETQAVSSAVQYIDFTNIKGDVYGTHVLIYSNMQPSVDNQTLTLKYSDDGGTTYEASSYDFGFYNMTANGTFLDSKSSSNTFTYLTTGIGTATGEAGNGITYIYNADTVNRHTDSTFHSVDFNSSANAQIFVGYHTYHVDSRINAFRVGELSGSCNWTGDVSLYGIRSY